MIRQCLCPAFAAVILATNTGCGVSSTGNSSRCANLQQTVTPYSTTVRANSMVPGTVRYSVEYTADVSGCVLTNVLPLRTWASSDPVNSPIDANGLASWCKGATVATISVSPAVAFNSATLTCQ